VQWLLKQNKTKQNLN